jgi:hypothetical protein
MKTLAQRRQEAREYNPDFPGYGTCLYCHRNWKICEPHNTPYQFTYSDQLPLRECFPLCEECWQELSIEERLPYYRKLWVIWQTGDIEQWLLMEKAVRKGL